MAVGGFDRTANLLGALSLFVGDRMTDAVTETSGMSSSAATALAALHHFLDGPSIDLLRQVLGLTSSGTVRLVDQLEQARCVERRSGEDGRTTSVWLTQRGRQLARRASDARAGVLESVVSVLGARDREALERITSQLLVSLMRGPGAVRWMCRLCDTQVCGHDTGDCPVTRVTIGRSALPSY